MMGWICPKCEFTWAWWVAGCSNCNVVKTDTADSTNQPSLCYCGKFTAHPHAWHGYA